MILRLILGDQLNYQHSWFQKVDNQVLYVMMEIRQETEYVEHHVQKIVGFFAAMRAFSDYLKKQGHHVFYIKISDPGNLQDLDDNLMHLITEKACSRFEYLLPDEYRLDHQLNSFCKKLSIPYEPYDTEHYYTERNELKDFFKDTKQVLMERFYRHMRRKHNILMGHGKPVGDTWNFDKENRKKLPENHILPEILTFNHDVSGILSEINKQKIAYVGKINPAGFSWPVNRKESLESLNHFIKNQLPSFGTYQDAMTTRDWSLYHSRLSFSLNTKMLSPHQVVQAVIKAWKAQQNVIPLSQAEGLIRQIIGWREFMRGIYWWKMPGYEKLNFFNHENNLPYFYWTGKTKMNCMHYCISQSLDKAYAHHIQRLMVTGNFALLAGVHPDQIDAWYLGIYIDAIQWVEITNTRGMSQFADGGVIASKPYISSASYIHKMSDYCKPCYYDHRKKYGEKACPFNSMYWNFLEQHRQKLQGNQRLKMMYRVWDNMNSEDKKRILTQAKEYINHLNER